MSFNPSMKVVRQNRLPYIAEVHLFVQPPFEKNCFDRETGLHTFLGELLTRNTIAEHDAVTVAHISTIATPLEQPSLSTKEKPIATSQHLIMTINHGIAAGDSRIDGIVGYAAGLVRDYHWALCVGDHVAFEQVLNSEPYQP